jgi:hypothetical protein
LAASDGNGGDRRDGAGIGGGGGRSGSLRRGDDDDGPSLAEADAANAPDQEDAEDDDKNGDMVSWDCEDSFKQNSEGCQRRK